jgi:hypothetical protein
MKIRILISITFIIMVLPFTKSGAQNPSAIQSFEISRQVTNKTGMIVLGSWAVGNILLGAYGNYKASGDTKYFHQFNAMWNVVNLGIAAFGYFNAAGSDPNSMTATQILNEYNSLQNFLLLNAGLDVAYMVTGLYLKERAKNSSNAERLRGYGNSLLLQGGFLLAFDVALYLIHQNNASVNFYPHLESLLSGGAGLGINLKL